MTFIDMFISLYHVNAVFSLTPTFWGQGYFKQLDMGENFSIHWYFFPILFYMLLRLVIFIHIFIYFTIFPNPHAFTLARGIPIKSGPGHIEKREHSDKRIGHLTL